MCDKKINRDKQEKAMRPLFFLARSFHSKIRKIDAHKISFINVIYY